MSTTDNEREALGELIHNAAMNKPEGERLFEQGPECYRLAGAILAAGFHRQGPITDEQVEAAARAIWQEEREETEWPNLTDSGRTVYRIMGRAALEAARNA